MLIDSSDSLDEKDKNACRLVIQYLQLGFDAILAPKTEAATETEEDEDIRYRMIFLWTVLVPPEFTGLLAALRGEALVVLGYYALLLHYGRGMWQVGDAGCHVLGLVGRYLGQEWDCWLDYPREMINSDCSL